MRAIFSADIQFGMINISVKLFSTHKDNSIKFNFLCPEGHKIVYKRYCPICQKEVSNNELKKGYYVSKSIGYVVFTQEEIKAIQKASEKIIKVIGFTDNANIDELMLDKTYYLLPEENYEKPYFFLKEILSLTNKSAIAKICMRNKERLCLIKSYKKGLVLITLHNIEDFVDFDALMELKMKNEKLEEIRKEEIELGKKLVEMFNTNFNEAVNNFKDTFRETFKELVKQKLEGKEIHIVVNENKNVAEDLVEQLKKSIELMKDKKEIVER